MKKLIMGLIAASAMIASTAMALDLGVDVRRTSGSLDADFYSVHLDKSLTLPVLGASVLSAETETVVSGSQMLSHLYAVGAGVSRTYNGVKLTPFLQVGQVLNVDAANQKFYGVGAKADYTVIGRVSLGAEYRFRDVLSGPHAVENRASEAVNVALTANHTVGLVAQQYFGTEPSYHTVGVSYKYSF